MKAWKSLFSKTEKPVTIKLVGHTDSILSIDAKSDHIMTGSEDFLTKIWDLKGKKVHTFEDHMGGVTNSWILDDYLISGGRDKKIIVWCFDWYKDLNDQEWNSKQLWCEGWITGIQEIRPGVIASSDYGGLLNVWNLKDGKKIQECNKHSTGIKRMCANQEMIATYADESGELYMRDIETLEVIGSLNKAQIGGVNKWDDSIFLNEIGSM